MRCGHAVNVGVDQQLVIAAVDRVVQDGLVEPELRAVSGAQRPVQHQRVADLRGHSVVHALIRAAVGYLRAVRVTQQHPYPDARPGLAGEDLLHAGVLGEEQPRVHEYPDLALGRGEQLSPHLPRSLPPVRVDGQQLSFRCRADHLAGQRVGPQIRLIQAQAGG
jgi:hypothetical protein